MPNRSKKLNPKFWNRIAKKYAAKPVSDEQAYQQKLKFSQDFLQPNNRLLEVGCGTGSTALVHAAKVEHIVATDFSDGMIHIARNKAEAQGVKNVEFRCEPVMQLSEHQDQYDVVMAHNILHLLDDVPAALNAIYQKLPPDGLLISSTPCVNDMVWFFKYLAPAGHKLGLIPYVNCFSIDEFKAMLGQAGFDLEFEWRPNKKASLFFVAKKRA